MQISINEAFVESARPEGQLVRAEISDEERAALVKVMQSELARPDNPLTITLDVGAKSGLELELYRHGRAQAAIWSDKPPEQNASLVAVSVLLVGENGPDDAAAVECLRQHGPKMNPGAYSMMLAATRPTVCITYMNGQWFINSKIDLAAMATALAHLGESGSFPTLRIAGPPTPEEAAEMQRQTARIMKVFTLIHNNAAKKGKYVYVVRPQEPVNNRPLNEIMHVKYWCGVDGQGGELLSIDELVAVFEVIRDQNEQLAGAKYHKVPTTQQIIKLRHEPRELVEMMKMIVITEPDKKPNQKQ